MAGSRRVFAVLLIFYLFRLQCCELFTSVAHLEAFIQVRFALLDRVRDYVELSERRLHRLERFIESDGTARPENDKRAGNISAVAHAVQLLVTFSRVRRKKQAVFTCLSDAQQKRKRKL